MSIAEWVKRPSTPTGAALARMARCDPPRARSARLRAALPLPVQTLGSLPGAGASRGACLAATGHRRQPVRVRPGTLRLTPFGGWPNWPVPPRVEVFGVARRFAAGNEPRSPFDDRLTAMAQVYIEGCRRAPDPYGPVTPHPPSGSWPVPRLAPRKRVRIFPARTQEPRDPDPLPLLEA